MKQTFVAALVGGLIIFFWQFLSWGLLNLHQPAQRYTPKQEAILSFLQQQGLEEGGYFMPSSPENASMEEYDKVLQAAEGKPWATIQYHKRLNTNMGMNMARGVVINILTVWLLCWIVSRLRHPNFANVLVASLFTGLVVFLNVPYTNFIWFESFDLWADLTDALVSWGLVGLWLGWFYGRKTLKENGVAARHRSAIMNIE